MFQIRRETEQQLNKDQMQIGKQSNLGLIVFKGLSSESMKIRAIAEFPTPTIKQESSLAISGYDHISNEICISVLTGDIQEIFLKKNNLSVIKFY